MGSVALAVLEFDEEVQVPWRPRLVVVHAVADVAASSRAPLARPSRRSPSRVGVCRPPVTPAPPARRTSTPRPERTARAPGPGGIVRRSVTTRAPAAGLRLTRRARRLAVVMALAAGVALGSWVGPLLGDGSEGLRLAGESSVVVQPGDTLWSIASSLQADGDVRSVIDRIQELNGLQSADLVPGQQLHLP